MDDHNLVAVIAIIFMFGAPAAVFINSRVLRHQERMEMLRRGIVPPEFTDKRAYRAWRRSGSPWPPPGAAQQTPWPPPGAGQQTPWVQPMPAGPVWSGSDDDPQRCLFKGIRVALIGFALTVGLGYAFGYHGNPIILGGLIPMFVGVAQIIIALLSGAQLPGIQPRMTFIPPPPHQQPPPGPGTPPPGYGAATPPPWAQQPGRQHFEELSKPVQPPDVR
jgi:hypothetical protein